MTKRFCKWGMLMLMALSADVIGQEFTITSKPKYEKPTNYNKIATTRWAGVEYTVRVATVIVPTGGGYQMPFLETEPYGVYFAPASELTPLFGADLVLEQTEDAAAAKKSLAATLDPLESKGMKAMAGSDGIHLGLSLLDRSMNLGDGLACDLKHFDRKVVFKAGRLQVKGETFAFKEGACMVAREGKLVAYGIKRSGTDEKGALSAPDEWTRFGERMSERVTLDGNEVKSLHADIEKFIQWQQTGAPDALAKEVRVAELSLIGMDFESSFDHDGKMAVCLKKYENGSWVKMRDGAEYQFRDGKWGKTGRAQKQPEFAIAARAAKDAQAKSGDAPEGNNKEEAAQRKPANGAVPVAKANANGENKEIRIEFRWSASAREYLSQEEISELEKLFKQFVEKAGMQVVVDVKKPKMVVAYDQKASAVMAYDWDGSRLVPNAPKSVVKFTVQFSLTNITGEEVLKKTYEGEATSRSLPQTMGEVKGLPAGAVSFQATKQQIETKLQADPLLNTVNIRARAAPLAATQTDWKALAAMNKDNPYPLGDVLGIEYKQDSTENTGGTVRTSRETFPTIAIPLDVPVTNNPARTMPDGSLTSKPSQDWLQSMVGECKPFMSGAMISSKHDTKRRNVTGSETGASSGSSQLSFEVRSQIAVARTSGSLVGCVKWKRWQTRCFLWCIDTGTKGHLAVGSSFTDEGRIVAGYFTHGRFSRDDKATDTCNLAAWDNEDGRYIGVTIPTALTGDAATAETMKIILYARLQEWPAEMSRPWWRSPNGLVPRHSPSFPWGDPNDIAPWRSPFSPPSFDRFKSPQAFKDGNVAQGQIGIHIQALTPELAKMLEVENARGIVITHVEPNSSAEKAGLQRNDVIARINGKEIDSAQHLSSLIKATPVGKEIRLAIVRDGKEREITVNVSGGVKM